MDFNPEKHKNDLLFLPLGGSDEIGMNVNLYHYHGKWLMIDCGIGFADDYLPGIDTLVADLSFIKKHRKNLVGLILTHAHEDHLGAVQYLWNELECPIYATNFTLNFLKIKLSEFTFHKKMELISIKPDSAIELGPFKIEMMSLTHSAPEMQAIIIKTPVGNIMHTGDWKLDYDPLIGNVTDEKLLKKYGDEGILALVCDSTNVFSTKQSRSEGELRESLVNIISDCSKLVVATTFASNLARLDTLIYAAKQTGRKVALTGRSLHRMIAAAQSSGYLCDIPEFVDERDVSNWKREDLLVIATGCQGETLAAVTKMSSGNHFIRLAPEDTVIFSSKIIPGNEKKVFRLFNSFVRKKVEVITEQEHFVHVSGHPSVKELEIMYKLIRPTISIPVHGEPVHLHEHAKLARSWGVKHAIEVENGNVIKIEKDKPKHIASVRTGYLGVEGQCLLPIDSPIFRMRRKIRDNGIIVITLLYKKGKIATQPVLSFPGCLDPNADADLIQKVKTKLHKELIRATNASDESIKNLTKSCVRKILNGETGKTSPMIVNIATI